MTNKRAKKPRATHPLNPDVRDLSTVDVIGLAELAKRWGVSKQRVDEISQRVPHRWKLSCGRIWLLHEVEEFERTWARKTGVHLDQKYS